MGWAVRPRLVLCGIAVLLAAACWLAPFHTRATPQQPSANSRPPADHRVLRVGATCVLLAVHGSPTSALGRHLEAHLQSLPVGPQKGCGPVLGVHLGVRGVATVGLAAAPADKGLVLVEDTEGPQPVGSQTILLPSLLDTAPPPLRVAQQTVYVLQPANGILLAAPLPWSAPLGTQPAAPFEQVGATLTVGGGLCVAPTRLAAYWALQQGCVPVVGPGPPLVHVPSSLVLRLQPGEALQASNLPTLLGGLAVARAGLDYGPQGRAWLLALQHVASRLLPGLAALPALPAPSSPARPAGPEDEDLGGLGEGKEEEDGQDEQQVAGPSAWQLLLGGHLFGPHDHGTVLASMADGTAQGLAAAQQAARHVLGAGQATVLGVYRQLQRARGPSYVLHVQAQGHVHTVDVQATYGQGMQATARGRVEAGPLHVLVALQGRAATAQRFGAIMKGLMAQDKELHLVVAVFGGPNEVTANRRLFGSALGAHTDRLLVVGVDGAFSRARGLHAAAQQVAIGLLLLCDVDMLLTPGALRRCRAGTVQGSQVYFPVVYSLQPGQLALGTSGGFFRESGLGMACMHRTDYQRVGGFAGDQFEAWGGEDVYLHGRFVAARTYTVFRAYEPGLVHLWHAKACPPGLSAAMALNCLRVLQAHLGAQTTLATLLYASGHSVLP